MNETQEPADRQPRAFSPADAVSYTFFVYDRDTGTLVHGHREVVLPYGDGPDKKQVMQRALQLAAEATHRDLQELRAIEVSEEDLTPGFAYRVDLSSQRLQRIEAGGARNR